MALTKPILYSQSAFDATAPHQFTFNVIGGGQVVRNQLIITNQDTNQIIYNQVQTTYAFTHTVPANVLTNGVYYSAYITTFDAQGNNSVPSIPIQFYCYSTPYFSFSNIPTSGIIDNSSYNFQLVYNQAESENLKSYVVHLYDAQRTEIANSGIQYVGSQTLPIALSYNFIGLNNNTRYYVRATAVTSEDTQISTDYIGVVVEYVEPSVFSIVELTNNCDGGYILVKSNLSAINGTSYPIIPIYIDNKELNVTENNNFVKWNEGYEIKGDFTASLWGRNFNVNSTIIRLKNKANDEVVINFRKDLENTYYAELTVRDNLTGATYYVYSESININNPNDNLQIWFRKINNLYEIKLHTTTREEE